METVEMLAEGVETSKIMIVWGILASIPFAYHTFIDESGPIGLLTLYVTYFILLLGAATVILYIIARGISLADIDSV